MLYNLAMIYQFMTLLLVFSTLFSCGQSSPSYKYDFAVCAIFKDEAPFFREWIEYHKLMGAEHFFLYNNESTDSFLDVLDPYINEGIVEVINWNEPDFQFSGQKKAYWDCIQKNSGIVKWLAVIDIDEFIVPKLDDTLTALLSKYDQKEVGGLCINWQMFGTSNVAKIESHELLTERLTLKAEENYNENLHVKSIVRPERVIEPPHVHYFEYQPGCYHVNTNGEPLPNSSRTASVLTDQAQINHYWTKDECFFFNQKVPRRLQWGDSMENIMSRLDTLNQIPDYSILRFVPQLLIAE